VNLNLVERGLAKVAPEWGLRRLAAKVALEQSTITVRRFDAARLDRRTESWRATGGSANAELAPALSLMIRRSRDHCRNNEWSVNAKRQCVAHQIGTGIAPRPKAGTAKQAKTVAMDAWNAFADNCDPEGLTDYYGIQARLAGEVFEGGAAFLRWYMRPSSFGLKVPLQCEVLEHDFLDTRRTEVRGDNVVIHGVEYDSFGRRVAYWLFPVHPGELNTIMRRGSNFISQRVPADECDHVFRVDRAGQVTGVPWLAPTMLRLRDAGDYEEAELVRKKIEACLTIFVKRTGAGPTGLAQSVDQSTDPKNAGRRLEKIAPGMIAYLQDGEEIQAATPSTSEGYADHMDQQLYAFAAGVGLPFSQASGKLTKANYSSMREGRLAFWAVLDQWQWFMLIPQACRPAWRRVMRTASARGLQVSGDLAADWTPPKRPWVDPVKDVQAEKEELALGLDSWPEKVSARGHDPEQLIEEILAWKERLDKAGLAPAQAPGLAGPAKPQQDPEREDDDDDDEDADE
jgi:lambda family phage portal protein